MLRRIPVPYTQIPSSCSPSGTNTASPWIGVHVRVVNPNHTEKGQHGIVRQVFHGQSDCHWKYSSFIKGLQVKLLVEISNASSDNVLSNMPSRKVELDYYSVVDAECVKLSYFQLLRSHYTIYLQDWKAIARSTPTKAW